MDVVAKSIDDSIIGKTLKHVYKGDIDITPPYVEILNDLFIISKIEDTTLETKNIFTNKKFDPIDYIILYTEKGISIFIEKKDDVKIEVE